MAGKGVGGGWKLGWELGGQRRQAASLADILGAVLRIAEGGEAEKAGEGDGGGVPSRGGLAVNMASVEEHMIS